MTKTLLLNMVIELVDLPIKNSGSFNNVNVYQGVTIVIAQLLGRLSQRRRHPAGYHAGFGQSHVRSYNVYCLYDRLYSPILASYYQRYSKIFIKHIVITQ
jgi:hypothetical protein